MRWLISALLVAFAALSACSGSTTEPIDARPGRASKVAAGDGPKVVETPPPAEPLPPDTEPPVSLASSEVDPLSPELPRITVGGVRISVTPGREDIGNGTEDVFDFDAEDRSGAGGGVVVPVGHEVDTDSIDVLAWSGSGNVILYIVETGPTVAQLVVSARGEVVDHIAVESNSIHPVATSEGFAATVITGYDSAGTEVGSCQRSEQFASLPDCSGS